jgi:hypothetical protein
MLTPDGMLSRPFVPSAREDGVKRKGVLLVDVPESRMKRSRRKVLVIALGAAVLACVGGWFGLFGFESDADQDYSRVESGLYIGSALDRPPKGTQAVVNLCGRRDRYEVEATLWKPVFESGKEPTLEWLRGVVEFIAEQRRAGRTTYVHCMAGMNRSGAAVAAYLMQEHGWGRDEALAFLKKKRSVVQPNPTLMRLLLEWEKTLKAAPDAHLQSRMGSSHSTGRRTGPFITKCCFDNAQGFGPPRCRRGIHGSDGEERVVVR